MYAWSYLDNIKSISDTKHKYQDKGSWAKDRNLACTLMWVERPLVSHIPGRQFMNEDFLHALLLNELFSLMVKAE